MRLVQVALVYPSGFALIYRNEATRFHRIVLLTAFPLNRSSLFRFEMSMTILMVYCRRAPLAPIWRFQCSMDHSFDRMPVSFTFTHTKLVTQSLTPYSYQSSVPLSCRS
jgi:hypothetical protein